jgi:hypothetical protein
MPFKIIFFVLVDGWYQLAGSPGELRAAVAAHLRAD